MNKDIERFLDELEKDNPDIVFDDVLIMGALGLYFDVIIKRYISMEMMGQMVFAHISRCRRDLSSLTRRLLAGSITPETWHVEAERILRKAYADVYAFASGGRKRVGSRLDSILEHEMRFLDGFYLDILSMWPNPDHGEIARRIRMYADRNYAIFWKGRLDIALGSGYSLYARRILGPNENHCRNGERPGCVELASLGWVPALMMTPIGEAQCLTNCKCTIEFSFDIGA